LIFLSYWFDIFLNSKKSKGSIITDRIDSIDEKTTYDILNILRLSNEYKINNIIERPLKTDSKMSNMIQIADITAFCTNKVISWKDLHTESKLTDKQKSLFNISVKLTKIPYNSADNPPIEDIIYSKNIILSKFKKLIEDNIIQ